MEEVLLLHLDDARKGPTRCTRPLKISSSQPSLSSSAYSWDHVRSTFAPPSLVVSGPSARLLQATQSVGAYESASSTPPPHLPLGRYEIIPRRALDSRLRARENNTAGTPSSDGFAPVWRSAPTRRERTSSTSPLSHESSVPQRQQRPRQPTDHHLRFVTLEAGPRRRVLFAEKERTTTSYAAATATALSGSWASARRVGMTTVATNPFTRPELRSKRRQWRPSSGKDTPSGSSSPSRHGATDTDSSSSSSAALLGRSKRPTREHVPAGWSVPSGFRKAADQFDEQHEFHSSRAQQTLGKVCGGASVRVESAAGAEKFRAELVIIRRGRLRLPEREVKKRQGMSWRRKRELREETKAQPRAEPPPWSLSRSIWAPRARYADSKSLWDTDAVELQRFESDWRYCLIMNLAKTILKLDDGVDDGEDEAKGEEEASDEVEDVKEVLWEFHDLLAQLFVHYAASGNDMHGVELNNWSDFTDDFKLVDKQSVACKRGDFDRLFIASNAKGDRVRQEMLKKQKSESAGQKKAIDRQSLMRRQRTVSLGGMGGRRGALNRVEFYVSLVTTACNKVCLPTCSRRHRATCSPPMPGLSTGSHHAYHLYLCTCVSVHVALIVLPCPCSRFAGSTWCLGRCQTSLRR